MRCESWSGLRGGAGGRQEGWVLTCSGMSMAGKRSETMAVNKAASSRRNLGMLLLRMAMISTTASSTPADFAQAHHVLHTLATAHLQW